MAQFIKTRYFFSLYKQEKEEKIRKINHVIEEITDFYNNNEREKVILNVFPFIAIGFCLLDGFISFYLFLFVIESIIGMYVFMYGKK